MKKISTEEQVTIPSAEWLQVPTTHTSELKTGFAKHPHTMAGIALFANEYG